MARAAEGGGPPQANGAIAPAELTALLSVVDSLFGGPSADGYSEEQKRGCIACAIRLPSAKLADVLSQLHKLAVSAWAKSSRVVDALLQRSLAVLLDVRVGAADSLLEAVEWRLARQRSWRRDCRLVALALLLKCNAAVEEELLKSALKAASQSTAATALCILSDAEAGASLEDARQGVVLRLARGGNVVAALAEEHLAILAKVLQCEPRVAKVTAQLPNAGWSEAAVEAARKLLSKVKGEAATDIAEPGALKALLMEPRIQQVVRLSALLKVPAEDAGTDGYLLRALAARAEDLPPATSLTALAVATAASLVLPVEGAEATRRASDALARHICVAKDVVPTAEQRLCALACLLRVPPKSAAVLPKLAQLCAAGGLPQPTGRDVAECLLMGKPLDSRRDRKPAAASALLAVLDKVGLIPDALKAVTEMIHGTVKKEVKQEVKKEVAEAPAAGGRFGLGALEMVLDDDSEGDSAPEPAAPAGVGGAAMPKTEEEGLALLKALVAEDEDEPAAAKLPPKSREQPAARSKSGAPALQEPAARSKAAAVAVQDRRTPTGPPPPPAAPKEEKKEEPAEIIEDDEDEGGSDEDEDEEPEEADSCSALSDELESYGGSELDPLDFPEDSEGEGDDAERIGEVSLGAGGLLTAVFGGGMLHSTEKRRKKQEPARHQRQTTNIGLVYPSLIWRSKDVLVVNKPADWICSASDVDKKKGRALDPNERCENKGFKVLDDLVHYKFADREKKYIHWWIQLMHNLDRNAYPNLFDEDQNYGLCHRLDRETSGTVLVGLTQLARQQMRECFHRHYVRKLYVCLAHGKVEPKEQTVDKNLEALGQKARLHPSGKRARTHVKVLANFTKSKKGGEIEHYSLCTCEIAEGRMHQIRLHMSAGVGSPIVSEFYYQNPKQMMEDRKWCHRVFLHAYAVGFPDVSGERRVGASGASPENDGGGSGFAESEQRQWWHCCICPLTEELRASLRELDPVDNQASELHKTICETGLLNRADEAVHVEGTENRKGEIDDKYFPWSSIVNPIEVGDLAKPREAYPQNRLGGERGIGLSNNGKGGEGKGGGKFNRDKRGGEIAALHAKAKPLRRNDYSPRRSLSPRGRGNRRVVRTGRGRSDRPIGSGRSPLPAPPPPRRPRRSRSRDAPPPPRRRAGPPPSPRGRSLSGQPRRKKRRASGSLSPESRRPLPQRREGSRRGLGSSDRLVLTSAR